jgi:hypothetical protein
VEFNSVSMEVRKKPDSDGVFLRFGALLLVICIVLPFVGQAFPYGLPVFGPVVLLTFCVVLISRFRIDAPAHVNLNIGTYGLLLLLVLVTYLYGILRTDTLMDYRTHVLNDLLNGIEALMLCIASVNIPWSAERLEKYGNQVITLLFVVTTLLAGMGLYKALLLYKGIQIPFIAQGNPGRPYPWGSSLVDDYDFYSLALLCGMLGATGRIVASKRLARRFVYVAGFLLMAVAGFLSGSRRFWVLAPLLITFELFILLKKKAGTVHAIGWLFFVLIIVVVGVLNTTGVLDQVFGLSVGGLDVGFRLQTLFLSHGAHGLGRRLALAQYALAMLDGWTVLLGHGFDYLRTFGCEFQSCEIQNYPHNPVLSALLYAGVAGAIAVIAFIVYVIVLVLRSLSGGKMFFFFGSCLAAEWVFVSISGNTILSVKSFLVTAIFCMLCNRYGAMAEITSNAHPTHSH